MSTIMRIIYLTIALLSIASCKSSVDVNSEKDETTTGAQPELKYTLSAFSPSVEFNGAQLTLNSYADGKMDFGVDGGGYELGVQSADVDSKMCANSAKGQHIHLIIDDNPYIAKYTDDFDHEMEDGDYNMLAFISRSYHESIKSDGSSIAQKITVKDNSISASEDIENAAIFYSRPKGTYVGKANTDKVMLDFFLVNADLGSDYHVSADINGEKHDLDKWQPYYIEGLPMGKNKITLSLLKSDGSLVDAPNNPVTREFELKADPTE